MNWMRDLPLHLLQAFYVFAQSSSMVEAARRLGITQPALSKQLQSLQEALPERALTQVGKRKVLTPFGENLKRELEPRLDGLQEAVIQAAQSLALPKNVTVRISARREILDRLADQIEFPGKVIFIEGGHDETLRALKDRRADVGLTYQVPESYDWIAKPCFRETFQLVVPKSLVRSEKDLPKALVSLPGLAYKEHDDVLESFWRSQNLEPEVPRLTRVTANYQSLAKMVEAGHGWAVLPVYYSVSTSKNWVQKVPPRLYDLREFQLVYRRELSQTPWLKSLVIDIQSAFRREARD